MLDCQDVIDNLFDYLDQEMTVEVQTSLKAHLDLCRNCFDRVQFEEVLRIKMRQKTSHCCPEKLKKRIQSLLDQF